MDAEETEGIPAQPAGLAGPFPQKRQGVFLERPPAGLRPVRVRRHGEQIGHALNPGIGNAIRPLQENSAQARLTGWADDWAPFVSFVSECLRAFLGCPFALQRRNMPR